MNTSSVHKDQYLTGNRLYPWVCFVVTTVVTLGLAGCGDRAEDSRQQMHKLQLAMMDYEAKHGGQWPDRLDQLKDEVGGQAAFSKVMKNPLTGDDPGYEYVKPKGKRGEGFDAQQVILYQLRGGKRDTSLKVGYADASVRLLGTK